MIILGLTGSIGMGKSTTAEFFKKRNIPTYNADDAVHSLYQDKAVIERIGSVFENSVINGQIDRTKISQEIIINPSKLKNLEQIIHPLVREKETEFVEKHRKNNEKLIVLDIPLLFETGTAGRVDKIAVVSAPLDVQRQRVLAREGWNEEKFNRIISRQMLDQEKRRRADFVIDTGKGMEHAEAQVKKIIANLIGSTD